MKLVLAEPKYFKDSISIISDLVSEVTFKVSSDGLEVLAMDPANVAMVIFKLLKGCFTTLEVKDKEEVALNLANLKQVLRRLKSDDAMTIETEDNKLRVEMKGKSIRSFSLPTLDLEEKEQRVPDLSFPISVQMGSSVLSDAVEDVSVVAESVTLLGEKGQLCVKAEGDLSKAFIQIPAGEDAKITSEGDKYKAKYSLEYLKKMIAGGKISDTVSVQFSNDYPLKLEYSVVDRLSLGFILAPRVDND